MNNTAARPAHPIAALGANRPFRDNYPAPVDTPDQAPKSECSPIPEALKRIDAMLGEVSHRLTSLENAFAPILIPDNTDKAQPPAQPEPPKSDMLRILEGFTGRLVEIADRINDMRDRAQL